MCKTHRRRQFKVWSKKRLKHDKNSFIFWKKSKKDIVKLNVLQCLNTITMKTLPWETWKNEIYSQLFFIYLGTQFGYTGVKNPLVYATGWLVLVFCFYFTRDIRSKTDFFVLSKKKKKICRWCLLLEWNKRRYMLFFSFDGIYLVPAPPTSVTGN